MSEQPTLLLLAYSVGGRGRTELAMHATDGVVVRDVDLTAVRLDRSWGPQDASFVSSIATLDARELRFLDRRIGREAKARPQDYRRAGWAREQIAARIRTLGAQPRRVNRTVLKISGQWYGPEFVPVSAAVQVVRIDVSGLRSTTRIDHIDQVRKARDLPTSLQVALAERMQGWRSALRGPAPKAAVVARAL